MTGAASGIGRAIALRLAAEGVNLFLVDIDEVGLADTVQRVRGRRASKSSAVAATSANQAKFRRSWPRFSAAGAASTSW